MKTSKFAKRYRHTISLVAIVALALAVFALNLGAACDAAEAAAVPLLIVGLWQLSQFALSRRGGVCYNSVLTPEQVKEFEGIIRDLKEVPAQIKRFEADLGLIKETPAQIKSAESELKKLQQQMDAFRRTQLAQKPTAAKRDGYVTEDCARHLGALLVLAGLRQEKLEGMNRDTAMGLFKDITGVETKAALTSSDIPLPIIYSGEVAELVGDFSSVRRYGTVFPLGGSAVKLPRLGTDPTFGLIAASGSVTEKSPTIVNVTFTAEKFGGLIRLPSELDADSIVPLGQFLARYSARQLAYIEDYQVFRSTGGASGVNGTAEGLTKNTITNSKVYVQPALGSPSEMTLAHLRQIRTIPDAAALRTGAYYMHPSYEQKLATFNASGDKPYNPAAQIGGTGANPMLATPTLDGFPIRWVDVMPVYTTSDTLSTVHVLFGDISYQYLGVRGNVRFDTSVEAGFTTDEILVRALERCTTGLMALGAVGGLQCAAA